MTLLRYFTRTATRNMRRGGQRALVSLLCVAFGVMSLVSMTLLSKSIARTLVLTPGEQIGADLSLEGKGQDAILPKDLAELQALQNEGILERFTAVSFTSSLSFHRPGSGELYFASSGIGIDPAVYPLRGILAISQPANVGPSGLLQGEGDVLITQDIALESGLTSGDRIILSDLETGIPVEGRIRGIVSDTPNHQGSKIYYTLATGQALAGERPAVNVSLSNAHNPEAAARRLAEMGWRATTAARLAENQKDAQELFDWALRGAGILGLLVGGVGIANTMQVLLRRRRAEMAIWKTLGYRQAELQLLFASEAALLGGAGSLLGAALGVGVSFILVKLFSRTTNLLISWAPAFSPLAVLGSVLVGVATTMIFALWAIVSASQVEPLALLRNEPVKAHQLPRLQSAGLFLALALPFAGLSSLVMGSLLKGAGVLLFALGGLILLGGTLGGMAWAASHLLSLRAVPLVRMAQTNLRRRGASLVFAMIALFVGVVSLGLGVVVTDAAGREIQEHTIRLEGSNLAVIAPADQEEALQEAFQSQGVTTYTAGYQSPVSEIRVSAEAGGEEIFPLLIGRTEPVDYQVEGTPWGSQPDGVYTYAPSKIPVGAEVIVTLPDGSRQRFPVVGSYTFDAVRSVRPQTGLLMPAALSQRLAPAVTLFYHADAPAGQAGIAAQLGKALPRATVVDLAAYAARYTQTYRNLFVFAVAMAALALLAGALLVANSVSLAMLDRRYEIGIFKAVGYARYHVLLSLAVEYSLVAVLASLAGLAAVQIFLWIIGQANPMAASLLVMSPLAAIGIGGAGVILTLLTVLGVTWKPTQVSPVVVLNDRA